MRTQADIDGLSTLKYDMSTPRAKNIGYHNLNRFIIPICDDIGFLQNRDGMIVSLFRVLSTATPACEKAVFPSRNRHFYKKESADLDVQRKKGYTIIGRTTEPIIRSIIMTSSPRPLVPISKSRLHEEIIGQIQDRIIKGELAPGEKLPAERDLAQNLGVNRGTVREALKKLEMLGLVEILHGDGIYVKNYLECGNLELLKSIIYSSSTMTAGIIKNLLELRRILAPEMAAAAAANRSEEEIARMKKIIASDEQSVLERDLAMHSVIARAAKNLPYVFILNFNNQVFRDFGHIYFDDAENRERSKKFHRDITAAIAGRKQDEARKIMRDVLAYTDRKIDEYYKIAPTKRRAGGNS